MIKYDFNKGWSYRRIRNFDKEQEKEIPVTIPHDAMLLELRNENNPGGKNAGFFEGNDYLYTKTLFVPAEWKDKLIFLELEGVYRLAEVFINGEKAAYRANGYTDFYVNIGTFLQYGKDNKIEVLAHNADQPNSRWYSGAGIYRPVWLYLGEREAIVPDGVRISTRKITPPEIELQILTTAAGYVTAEIWDGDVCLNRAEEITQGKAVLQMVLPEAELWSVENPRLYTWRIYFGKDTAEGTFGIRLLEWDEGRGFCINKERVILRGACIHHDNGLLGACAYAEAEERKIAILKENGYNAIRSAHNPCSRALLDACDRLGMLVMDEYTDMWYIHKTAYDYADYLKEWWRKDLTEMVKKDYNHPSVILYSIGNEVAETAQPEGIALTGEMTKYLHFLDETRPVTCGINIFFNLLSSLGFGVYSDDKAAREKERKHRPVGSEFYNTLAGIFGATIMKLGATLHGCDVRTKDAFANMDIAGYNYGILRYRKDLKKYSKRLILGTETFCSDAFKFWEMAKKNKRIIGDFVWAGMDYIGEAGIGAWEYEDYAPRGGNISGWLTAGSGRIDITGKPSGEASYTKIAFEQEEGPLLAVRPVYQTGRHSPSAWKMTDALASWSWRGCEGKRACVEVYTRAWEVSLFINGNLIKKKRRKKDCRIIFFVPYEEGELMAVAYDKEGREQSRACLRSAGEETVLRAVGETESAKHEGLYFVRIRYTDAAGILKPMERHQVTVKVEGGRLLGLGNACPYNREGYLNAYTETYYGEALAVIRAENRERMKLWVFDIERRAELTIPVLSDYR